MDRFVQSNVRAFGRVGDWKATVLEEEERVERSRRVDGGLWPRGGNKRYMRLDIARRRDRQRGWGENCCRTRKRRTFEATPFGLVYEPKEPCTGARRPKT